jgi:hypothetical protein
MQWEAHNGAAVPTVKRYLGRPIFGSIGDFENLTLATPRFRV